MVTSKGAAGVTGSGFIVLAATLSAVGDVPVAGLALILGIDRFMSEARALTNLIGNGVATLVVARWCGELDRERLRARLAGAIAGWPGWRFARARRWAIVRRGYGPGWPGERHEDPASYRSLTAAGILVMLPAARGRRASAGQSVGKRPPRWRCPACHVHAGADRSRPAWRRIPTSRRCPHRLTATARCTTSSSSGGTTTLEDALHGQAGHDRRGRDHLPGHGRATMASMNMTMDQGTMTMKMSGKRLGDCDAGAIQARDGRRAETGRAAHRAQVCAEPRQLHAGAGFRRHRSELAAARSTRPTSASASRPRRATTCSQSATSLGPDATTDLEAASKACGVEYRRRARQALQERAWPDELDSLCSSRATAPPRPRRSPRPSVPAGSIHGVNRSPPSSTGVLQRLCGATAAEGVGIGGRGWRRAAGSASGAAGSARRRARRAGTVPPPKDSAIDASKKALKKLFPF